MNKLKASIGILVLVGMFFSHQAQAEVLPDSRPALIRLYNATINDHFYTTDGQEALAATQFYGYRWESAMGYLETTQLTGTVSVIRMWNPQAKKHFYTTNEAEATAVAQAGFVREGVIGYIRKDVAPAASPSGDEQPTVLPEQIQEKFLYRLYNPSLRKHFYTIDRQEMLNVLNMGYRLEGDLGELYKSADDRDCSSGYACTA